MIKRKGEQQTEVREDMRGGTGKVTIRHFFKKDEIQAPSRLCAELLLPPGTSIGMHEHISEDEVFIIQEGKARVTDEGKEIDVAAGDAILTGKGGAHAIQNIGDTDLRVTAVIMQYKSV